MANDKKGFQMEIPSYDDIFSTQDQRDEQKKERIIDVSISDIKEFANHPFKVKNDDEMQEMIRSVKEYGVLVPVLLRASKDGAYEMISGHRRMKASLEANFESIPAIVRELSDEEATIIMVDSNLQREHILPSEKAFAYKMKLDAIKRKSGRPEKGAHGAHLFSGEKSRDIVAAESGENSATVSRYIRLTELIPKLLERVDKNELGFIAAVDISYLDQEQQSYVYNIIKILDLKPTKAQAAELKKRNQRIRLSKDEIEEILLDNKKKAAFSSWRIQGSEFKRHLPEALKDTVTPEKAERIFVEAMQLWKEKYEKEN